MKLKSLVNSIVPVLVLGLAGSARGQTNTNSAPATNPLITVLQNTIVDTNSVFFNATTLELRALTQTTLTTYESVLSATYYPGTNGNFGIGAEIINGALNVTDDINLTLEYAMPYHNLKFRPLAGIGYDFVNRSLAAELGGGIEVAISQNLFADTEVLYKIPFKSFQQTPGGEVRLGLGWKF